MFQVLFLLLALTVMYQMFVQLQYNHISSMIVELLEQRILISFLMEIKHTAKLQPMQTVLYFYILVVGKGIISLTLTLANMQTLKLVGFSLMEQGMLVKQPY